MGVDSGLPDFRGSTGLFKDKELAMSYEELALSGNDGPWFFVGMLQILQEMSDDKWFSEDPL